MPDKKLPRVIASRSVQRVLSSALDILDNYTDDDLPDNIKEKRDICVDDLKALIKNGFE